MAIELEASDGSTTATSSRAGEYGKLNSRIKSRERSAFFERLSLMLDAGTSLHSALESMLRSGNSSSALLPVILQLKKDVNNGSTFADALGKHPNLIAGVQLKLISAGEQGGFLPEVITKIVDFEARQHKLRSSLVGALTYPAVLMFVSVLVCMFVLLVVFPQFKEMFSSMEDKLPLISRLMFSFSNQLTENSQVIIPLFGIGFFLVFKWLFSDVGKAAVKLVLFRIPFTRAMYINYAISQMTRVLGLALEHGVSVSDALFHLKGSFANSEMGKTLDDVELLVDSGQGLSAGFSRSPHMPDLVKQLVSAGEEAGALAQVFSKLASHYETEIDRQVGLLGKIAEPVMLLIMGILIGGLVSALILPIFKLSTNMG